ncbi:MAG TPA: hypothetical protein VM869_21145 [Enhygromyxa sp.]|nr:hypothetical protein [Enhygromyxa sp.]
MHKLLPIPAALLLLACKPDMDAKVLEAAEARAEAECNCNKEVDYKACRARVNKEHPSPGLEDGWAVKYSKDSVARMDAAIQMSIKCSDIANSAGAKGPQ